MERGRGEWMVPGYFTGCRAELTTPSRPGMCAPRAPVIPVNQLHETVTPLLLGAGGRHGRGPEGGDGRLLSGCR